jgi:hypothetical protein
VGVILLCVCVFPRESRNPVGVAQQQRRQRRINSPGRAKPLTKSPKHEGGVYPCRGLPRQEATAVAAAAAVVAAAAAAAAAGAGAGVMDEAGASLSSSEEAPSAGD